MSPPIYAGNPSGLVVTIRNGPTIYHTGDTAFFSDIARVSDYNQIDVHAGMHRRSFHHGTNPCGHA